MTTQQMMRISPSGVLQLVFFGVLLVGFGADLATSEFHPGKVHIVLVGDSTVTDNAGW